MVGILRTSIPGYTDKSPAELLRDTVRLGLDGLMLSTPLDISPTLDRADLRAFRREAEALGVTVGTSIGWFNPLRPDRNTGAFELGRGDPVEGIARLIESATELGVPGAFFQIGSLEDRFGAFPPWHHHLETAAKGLERLAPLLRRTAMKLLLKTHEEMTSREILRLIDRVGGDVLGVALDPVNLLVRLENPWEATRRLTPHVAQVHLDDAQLRRDGRHLRRLLCDFGQGCIDWSRILTLVPDVPLWIELHRGQFAMPVEDKAWLASQPDLDAGEAAQVVAMAGLSADREPPDQTDPYTRLGPLIAYARTRRERGNTI